MKIQIGKFTLRSDQYSYWVEEEYIGKDAKTGKEKKQTKRVAGYSTTLEQLYRSFVQHKFRSSEAETVKELIADLKQVEQDIIEIRKTATKEGFKRLRVIGKRIKEVNE